MKTLKDLKERAIEIYIAGDGDATHGREEAEAVVAGWTPEMMLDSLPDDEWDQYDLSGGGRGESLALARQLHDLMWPPGDPDADWSPDTLDRIAGLVKRACEGAADRVFLAFVDRAQSRPAAAVKGPMSPAEADGFLEAVNWVDDSSIEYVGRFTTGRAARRAAGVRLSGQRPTVRFWIYHNGSYARLKLGPGDKLEVSAGGPTEEGYHHEYQCWRYDADDEVVRAEEHTDARDCDGRVSSGCEFYCPVDRLAAGRKGLTHRRIRTAYGSDEALVPTDDVVLPDWREGEESYRDYAAEAAGY